MLSNEILEPAGNDLTIGSIRLMTTYPFSDGASNGAVGICEPDQLVSFSPKALEKAPYFVPSFGDRFLAVTGVGRMVNHNKELDALNAKPH